MQTREEYIEWCKMRALEYLDTGNVQDAIASMLSDLSKHDQTKAVGATMGPLGVLEAMNGSIESVRRFIEGFR